MKNIRGYNRVNSIDDFRGFSVTMMLFANLIVLFIKDPPEIIGHAEPGTILPFDLVAPFFGFAIGLSVPFFKEKYISIGTLTKRIFSRVLILYAVGKIPNFLYRFIFFEETIIDAFLNSWSILETWAIGLILTALLLELKIVLRIVSALMLLLVYQTVLLYYPAVFSYVSGTAEGGIVAVLAWVLLMVMGSSISELLKKLEVSKFVTTGVLISFACIISGLILHNAGLVLLERLIVSPSYILLSTGIAILSFFYFYFFNPTWSYYFRNIGRYPLQAWILHSIFYIPVYATIGGSYFEWPLGGLIVLTGVIVLITLDEMLIRAGIKLKA